MVISLQEKGEVESMGIALQNEYNELEKRQQELQKTMKRIVFLQKAKPTDQFGDEVSDTELPKLLEKARGEFKKCMPDIDLAKPQKPTDS